MSLMQVDRESCPIPDNDPVVSASASVDAWTTNLETFYEHFELALELLVLLRLYR